MGKLRVQRTMKLHGIRAKGKKRFMRFLQINDSDRAPPGFS